MEHPSFILLLYHRGLANVNGGLNGSQKVFRFWAYCRAFMGSIVLNDTKLFFGLPTMVLLVYVGKTSNPSSRGTVQPARRTPPLVRTGNQLGFTGEGGRRRARAGISMPCLRRATGASAGRSVSPSPNVLA